LFLSAGGPTHWLGMQTQQATWTRYATPAKYDMSYYNGFMKVAKKIGTTTTLGVDLTWSTSPAGQGFIADSTVASRRVLALDITKGSPNFSLQGYGWDLNTGSGAMADTTVATYSAQIVLPTPVIASHSFSDVKTLAIDEATNGYFNAVGIAWDRSDALIELSDVSVVRLA
jgi:hypothetical protein